MSSPQAETVLRIPLTQLIEDDGNVRSKLTGIEELAESLKTLGQLQPILVTATRGDVPYRVVAGHRRLAAARLAGIETLSAIVVDGEASSTRTVQLVENIQREDLPALDVADALREMLADDKNADALAKRVSKPIGWVRRHLALLKVAPELVAAMRKARLPFAQAEEVVRIAKSGSTKDAMAAAAMARDGKASKRELRELADARASSDEIVRKRTFSVAGAGFKVAVAVSCDAGIDDVAESQLNEIAEAAATVLARMQTKADPPAEKRA
jgi:ParB/RepB/Spo0J family partition protein